MAKTQVFKKPKIREKYSSEHDEKATWLELFFDLFFVLIVFYLIHELAYDFSYYGLFHFILAFLAAWWIWIGYTFLKERFESDGLEIRLFTFLLMIPISGLAIFSHHALGENYFNFILSYIIARTFILFGWIYGAIENKAFRPTAKIFIPGFTFSIILLIFSLFISEFNILLLVLALIIDLITPILSLREQKKLPVLSRRKISERFGLFVIIVLGEVLRGVVESLQDVEFSYYFMSIGIIGIAIGFFLWSSYFDFVGRRIYKSNIYLAAVYNYMHIPLIIGFSIIGAGLLKIEAEVIKTIQLQDMILLSLGFALVLITIGILEFLIETPKRTKKYSKISTGYFKIILGILSIIIVAFFNELNVFVYLTIMLLLLLLSFFHGLFIWIYEEIIHEFQEIKK